MGLFYYTLDSRFYRFIIGSSHVKQSLHTEFRTVQALLACKNEKMNLFRIHIKIGVGSIGAGGADILCRAAHLQHAWVFELH